MLAPSPAESSTETVETADAPIVDATAIALYRAIDRIAADVSELRHLIQHVLAATNSAPLQVVDDPEHARTLQALEQCNGNQTRAARMLGIARSTLVKRLDHYNVPRPRK